jgi:hypothetical protein
MKGRGDQLPWRIDRLLDTREFGKQASELLRQGLHKAGIGKTPAEVVAASKKGITLKKTSAASPLQQLYEAASEHCRSHDKKSSLISSSPPTYMFGCY